MATAGDTFQRKEKKYLISSGQCKAIKEGLTSHMRLDDYGATRIDSLYLDSFDHNLICKSLEKPLYKEKLGFMSLLPALLLSTGLAVLALWRRALTPDGTALAWALCIVITAVGGGT
ncbi:MAG: VTC domain-containing protein, partial [Eggerthellaceae bacterium]|nr:VTC domain-containing protein [Eggerthellaceae bacterium]